jgi:hypothetical protein
MDAIIKSKFSPSSRDRKTATRLQRADTSIRSICYTAAVDGSIRRTARDSHRDERARARAFCLSTAGNCSLAEDNLRLFRPRKPRFATLQSYFSRCDVRNATSIVASERASDHTLKVFFVLPSGRKK